MTGLVALNAERDFVKDSDSSSEPAAESADEDDGVSDSDGGDASGSGSDDHGGVSETDSDDEFSDDDDVEDRVDPSVHVVPVPFVLSAMSLDDYANLVNEKTGFLGTHDGVAVVERESQTAIFDTYQYARCESAGHPLVLGEVYRVYDDGESIGVFTVVNIQHTLSERAKPAIAVTCQEWISLEDAQARTVPEDSGRFLVTEKAYRSIRDNILICTSAHRCDDGFDGDLTHVFIVGANGDDSAIRFAHQNVLVVPSAQSSPPPEELKSVIRTARTDDSVVVTRNCVVKLTDPKAYRVEETPLRTPNDLYQFTLVTHRSFMSRPSHLPENHARLSFAPPGTDVVASEGTQLPWVPGTVVTLYKKTYKYLKLCLKIKDVAITSSRLHKVLADIWDGLSSPTDIDREAVQRIRVCVNKFYTDCKEVFDKTTFCAEGTFPMETVSFDDTCQFFSSQLSRE